MPLPPGYQPYQVQQEDKDLLTLAARLNVPFQTLKQANSSITSISQGQFINVPKPPAGPPKPPALSPGASAAVSGIPEPSGPYNISSGVGQYLAGANLPPGYPGNYQVPGSLAAPFRPNDSPDYSPALTGDRNIEMQNDMIRVYQLKTTMQNAKDPSQMPKTISNADAARMGFPPAQMIQAGYVMKNGNWILSGGAGGTGSGSWTSPTTGNTYQSANNWETNPALHMVVFNRNAKNKNSKFVTTEKWAQNAYRRKKRAAKGIGVTQPGNDIRADTPSTTLDLVLGT